MFCSSAEMSSSFCSSYIFMHLLVSSMCILYLESSSVYWGMLLIASLICFRSTTAPLAMFAACEAERECEREGRREGRGKLRGKKEKLREMSRLSHVVRRISTGKLC